MSETSDRPAHAEPAGHRALDTIRMRAEALRDAYLIAERRWEQVAESLEAQIVPAMKNYADAERALWRYCVQHHAELRGLGWANDVLSDHLGRIHVAKAGGHTSLKRAMVRRQSVQPT